MIDPCSADDSGSPAKKKVQKPSGWKPFLGSSVAILLWEQLRNWLHEIYGYPKISVLKCLYCKFLSPVSIWKETKCNCFKRIQQLDQTNIRHRKAVIPIIKAIPENQVALILNVCNGCAWPLWWCPRQSATCRCLAVWWFWFGIAIWGEPGWAPCLWFLEFS